jgi:hypothetical protein
MQKLEDEYFQVQLADWRTKRRVEKYYLKESLLKNRHGFHGYYSSNQLNL